MLWIKLKFRAPSPRYTFTGAVLTRRSRWPSASKSPVRLVAVVRVGMANRNGCSKRRAETGREKRNVAVSAASTAVRVWSRANLLVPPMGTPLLPGEPARRIVGAARKRVNDLFCLILRAALGQSFPQSRDARIFGERGSEPVE